tara:strand:+ start:306 stop:1196 length:891 start_codon:yes stop_codon:yes gene_type:complete
MITVVYGTHNGTQDSIAWWLSNSMTKNVGPQTYEFVPDRYKWSGTADNHSALVLDSIRLQDEYLECHRLMENVEGDIIAPIRKFEKNYDMLLWSNFFGTLEYPDQKIDCDKLIICDETAYEDTFHYTISHAFRTLTKKYIDDHSELWWTDHKVVNDNVTDNWKKVWYDTYHQKMHDEFDKGNLLYMWQLNYMHWDVNSLIEGKDIKPTLEPADNLKRLLFEKLIKNNPSIRSDRTLWANPDALYIRDPHWFNKANKILEFLEIERCNKLVETLDKYKYEYTIRRDWFDSLVKKTLS